MTKKTTAKKIAKPKKPIKKVPVLNRRMKYLSVGLIVLGIFVLLFGITRSLVQWHDNSLATNKAKQLIYDANHNISHVVPATIKPTLSEFDSYSVAPDLPRYIFIPAINVKAIVGQVGLLSNGQLGTPDNVYDTDWYNASSKPGEPGAMVVDGHVSSWTTNGVFYNLKLLQVGDIIQIEKGDGSLITYKVMSKQIYNYQNVNMTTVLSAVNPNVPGLNLITCTGDVIPGTNEFNQRIVIYASETSS